MIHETDIEGGIKKKKKKSESHETENYGPFLFENGEEGRTGGKMTISLYYCNMVGRIPKNSTNLKHTDKKMNLILKVNQVS